mmetsp:Transcript_38649/g.121051  ORF Transcript_38649/g.121051 Transcript_38649/m.121051 type:complete len:214 (-) Transcript_38649:193-834(-)
MPRSRRDRTVALTRTEKKGKEKKQGLIDQVREALESFEYSYVFEFDNMRSTAFKEFRRAFPDGRFFLGRNRVMQLALGRSEEEEVADNAHMMARALKGHRGLFCTSRDPAAVAAAFTDFEREDYARSGSAASETVKLEAGPLPQFVLGQMDQLRKLGLVCEVKNSTVCLMEARVICKEGQTLTPESAKLLEMLGMKTAVSPSPHPNPDPKAKP